MTAILANIVGATNATPIVLQTSMPHGFANGDPVVVFGVLGTTSANSPANTALVPPFTPWTITVVDSTHFSLNGSAGNGTYQLSATGIAADVLNPPQALPAPATGFYGHDLSCISDLDPNMAEVDDHICLLQALARRITTSRGTLIDDPNYGFDIRQFLEDDLDVSQLARIGASVDAEFLKDERIIASSTTVTLVQGVMIVSSNTTGALGPFKFVLSVQATTVTILTQTS